MAYQFSFEDLLPSDHLQLCQGVQRIMTDKGVALSIPVVSMRKCSDIDPSILEGDQLKAYLDDFYAAYKEYLG